MKILHVVGARPNFMKIAPIMEALRKYPDVTQVLVHTGQHYDEQMSKLFFDDLGIPEPDINLEVGSASHAVQTAEIMKHFEGILLREKPVLVLVVGVEFFFGLNFYDNRHVGMVLTAKFRALAPV